MTPVVAAAFQTTVTLDSPGGTPFDLVISVDQYVDGTFIETSVNDSFFSQETIEVAESVPEPDSVVPLLGLGLGLLTTHCKKQA